MRQQGSWGWEDGGRRYGRRRCRGGKGSRRAGTGAGSAGPGLGQNVRPGAQAGGGILMKEPIKLQSSPWGPHWLGQRREQGAVMQDAPSMPSHAGAARQVGVPGDWTGSRRVAVTRPGQNKNGQGPGSAVRGVRRSAVQGWKLPGRGHRSSLWTELCQVPTAADDGCSTPTS